MIIFISYMLDMFTLLLLMFLEFRKHRSAINQ